MHPPCGLRSFSKRTRTEVQSATQTTQCLEFTGCLRTLCVLSCSASLSVTCQELGDQGAVAIAASGALQSPSSLRSLNLARNGIGERGAAALAAAMFIGSDRPSCRQPLRVLLLGYNRVGDEGARALGGE